MFRFFRRENLKSTRRRSASCPNLQQSLSKEIGFDGEYLKEKPVDDCLSSESEADESISSNNIEKFKDGRLKASNKENKNNGHSSHNVLCMDDYLSKLPELKLWLKEEGKKDVDSMKTAKLKSHFKDFMKLWNKQKLAPKYYTDELFNSLVNSNDLFQSALEESSKDSSNSDSLLPLPPLLDMSIDHTLDEGDGLTGSPFSTFGKVPDDPKNSPASLAQQLIVNKVKDKTVTPTLFKQVHSPTSSKFATILRSTPVASLFKTDSTFPRSSKFISGVKPVPSPKCPHQPPYSWATPAATSLKTVSQSVSKDNNPDTKDFQKWVDGWNRFTNQSPIYDTVADSIHVNKESPGYSEVIPCGQLESGYCSLSPFKSQRSPSKCAPKQPSLNRRRSKSMEDIYSISAKFNHVDVSRKPVVRREEVDVAVSYAPPIPDRNYSPVKLLSPKHSFNTRSSVSIKTPASSTTSASPSTVKADLFQRLVGIQEISPKKRRSQEGDENVRDSASPVKKTKPESHETSDLFADKDSFASISDPKLVESTPVLSILTGSMNPTTRSKYKLMESDNKNLVTNAVVLNPMQLQQLEESPKLPRRRLKRRSSSFSTTPGKGLTFGKSSKLSVASPKRKVSFAKDVKDPERDGTSMRRSSSRPALLSNQITCTKQTKDRMEFEAFLFSHTTPKKVSSEKNSSQGKDISPGKRSSPNKAGSPGKMTSPVKPHTQGKDVSPGKHTSPNKVVSLSKIYSPGKVHTPDKIPASEFPSPQQLVAGLTKNDERTADLMQTQHQSQISMNILPTDEERLFPTSPTRQLGRRVLGKPTSKSYKANTCSPQTGKLFEQPASPAHSCSAKKSSPPKRIESQLSLALPKKTISSLVMKLTEKTVTICANEMSESEGYSSSEDLLSTAACFKTDSMRQFDHKDPYLGVDSETSEPLNVLIAAKNVNSTPCAVDKNQPNEFSDQKECLFTTYSKGWAQQIYGVDPVNTIESHYSVPNSQRGNNLQSILANSPRDNYCLNKTLVKTPSAVSFTSKTDMHGAKTQNALSSTSVTLNDRVINSSQLEDFKMATGKWYAAVGSKISKENVNNTDCEVEKNYSPCHTKGPCEIHAEDNGIAPLDSELEHQLYKVTGLHEEFDDPTNCTPDRGRGASQLERMHSIRPSPKITDSDGWVTQRRSSRGLRKSPFLSASSKSSSLEEEKPGEVKLSSQEIVDDYPVIGSEPDISAPQPIVQVQENSSFSPDVFSTDFTKLAGVSSPQKVKPPVMPKPTLKPKPSVLTARAINLMKPAGHLTTSTKRRSSLNKNGNSLAKPHYVKEDYIQKNINAVASVKLGSGSPQKMLNQPGLCDQKQPNMAGNVTRRRSKTLQQDSSSVTATDRRRSKTMIPAAFTASTFSKRKSKIGAHNATLGTNSIRRRSKTTVPEMESSPEPAKPLTDNRRRRSRTSNQNNENAVSSFAARRNFFQQFQVQASVRPGTLHPSVSRPGVCHPSPSKLNLNVKEVPSSSSSFKSLALETKRKVKCEIETEI